METNDTNPISFFKSTQVKIFPCYSRGSEDFNVIDPEARLLTEANFTKIYGSVLGQHSYIISLSNPLRVVIQGYYFEIQDTDTKFTENTSLIIKLAPRSLVLTDETKFEADKFYDTYILAPLNTNDKTCLDFLLNDESYCCAIGIVKDEDLPSFDESHYYLSFNTALRLDAIESEAEATNLTRLANILTAQSLESYVNTQIAQPLYAGYAGSGTTSEPAAGTVYAAIEAVKSGTADTFEGAKLFASDVAATAKSEAITAAAADATSKANTAEANAKAHAETKASAAETTAKGYADSQDAALQTAIEGEDTDATYAKTIKGAKDFATAKAAAAESAAKSYADGIVATEKAGREAADTALEDKITALRNEIGNLTNVMNFCGAVDAETDITDPVEGDVITIKGTGVEKVYCKTAEADGDTPAVYEWIEIGTASASDAAIAALQERMTAAEEDIGEDASAITALGTNKLDAQTFNDWKATHEADHANKQTAITSEINIAKQGAYEDAVAEAARLDGLLKAELQAEIDSDVEAAIAAEVTRSDAKAKELADAAVTAINTTMNTRIGDLETASAAHTEAIGDENSGLVKAIATEKDAREQADSAINDKIGELPVGEGAYTTLVAGIADAKKYAEELVAILTGQGEGDDAPNSLAAETTARIEADAELTERINIETAARRAAEDTLTELTDSITVEIGRAKDVEANLADRISVMEVFWDTTEDSDSIVNKLKEIQDYIAADETGATTMAGNIQTNTNAIAVLNGDEEGSVNKKIADAIAPLATTEALNGVKATAEAAATKNYTDTELAKKADVDSVVANDTFAKFQETNTTAIATIANDLQCNTSNIVNLTSDLADFKGHINEFTTDLARRMSEAEEKLSTKVDYEELGALENKLTAYADNVLNEDTLASKVTEQQDFVNKVASALGGNTFEIYAVAFDANGGKGYMPPQIVIGSAYTLPISSFEGQTEYHQFRGWSTSLKDETVLRPNDSCEVKANITFYALWEEKHASGEPSVPDSGEEPIDPESPTDPSIPNIPEDDTIEPVE
jgi:hypothetical protein